MHDGADPVPAVEERGIPGEDGYIPRQPSVPRRLPVCIVVVVVFMLVVVELVVVVVVVVVTVLNLDGPQRYKTREPYIQIKRPKQYQAVCLSKRCNSKKYLYHFEIYISSFFIRMSLCF